LSVISGTIGLETEKKRRNLTDISRLEYLLNIPATNGKELSRLSTEWVWISQWSAGERTEEWKMEWWMEGRTEGKKLKLYAA